MNWEPTNSGVSPIKNSRPGGYTGTGADCQEILQRVELLPDKLDGRLETRGSGSTSSGDDKQIERRRIVVCMGRNDAGPERAVGAVHGCYLVGHGVEGRAYEVKVQGMSEGCPCQGLLWACDIEHVEGRKQQNADILRRSPFRRRLVSSGFAGRGTGTSVGGGSHRDWGSGRSEDQVTMRCFGLRDGGVPSDAKLMEAFSNDNDTRRQQAECLRDRVWKEKCYYTNDDGFD